MGVWRTFRRVFLGTTKTSKLVRGIAALGLLGVLVLASLELAFYLRFERNPAAADFSPPASKAQARVQDVAHLSNFFELERSWSDNSLMQARQLYSVLEVNAAEMTDGEFEMAVAEIVAAAENAHTKVREYARTPRYSRLPIRGHWFADGYHIVRAFDGFEQYLGAEIIAVEAVAMDQLIETLGYHIAGPLPTVRKYAPYILESPELMHGIGLADDPTELSVNLRLVDGSEKELVFQGPFPDSSDQIARSHLLLAPQVYSESQPEWRSLLPLEADLPLYLKNVIAQLSLAHVEEINATYVQFTTNNNAGDLSIRDFCESSWEEFKNSGDRVLILDQRFNGGGNYLTTRDCLKKMGRELPANARMYVIVAGPTFSAGMYSAAFPLSEAGDRAILIGETMGDNLQSWSEDNTLVLPNSGIEINFSTGMHDLNKRCNNWRKCFWSAMFEDVQLESPQPAITIEQTYSAYAAGRDPILDEIIRRETKGD